MLTKKKYTRSRPLLVAVSLMAVVLAFLLTGCQTEAEPEPQKQQQPGNAGSNGTSGNTNNGSTGGENTGNTGSSGDIKPEECTHNPSQDVQTCKGYQCKTCGIWYGDKNPENHASTQFTYTNKGDGTHGKEHQCCGAEGQAEPHEIAQPKYTWSADYSICTAEASCPLCKGAVTETADRDASTDAGVTATFKNAGFEAQTIAKVTFAETIPDYLMSNYVQVNVWDPYTEQSLRNPGGAADTIGTQDPGKTAWEEGDKILVSLESKVYGRQAATLTFTGGDWGTSLSPPLHCLQGESPAVTAVYAPGHEIKDDKSIAPKGDSPLGTSEYITFDSDINDGKLRIIMEGTFIDYSRLRIAATPNQMLNVTVTDFIPAGTQEEGEHTYTRTADGKGNAYLYGALSVESIVTVDSHPTTVGDYYENGTQSSISYALSATPTE